MLTLAQSSGMGAVLIQLLPMLVIFGLLMFFMNRSQKKQQQQRAQFLDSIHVGDKITTIGGLHGVVHEIDETNKIITIDCDGVYLDFDLQAIKNVVGTKSAE